MTPLLVLLNGGPASGKSTTARRWVADHPLALALDIDVLRSMLGAWTNEPSDAGLIARRLALAMARSHLLEGRDVIIPQYLGPAGLPYIHELESLAAEAGATFVELVLTVPPEVGQRRLQHRQLAVHRTEEEEAVAVHGSLGAESMEQLARTHEAFIRTRRSAVAIESVDGDPAATAQRLVAAIALVTRSGQSAPSDLR